jgi:RHS repeat-associated protein
MSESGSGESSGALASLGKAMGAVVAVEQKLSTALNVVANVLPSFPAVRITDIDIGVPHAHGHPPNLIPPAPPVPLPSTGPIIPIPILSGATKTLINGVPAARCGDMGLGIWCGGYLPMYEIFLGSSNVWIEGGRAARVGVDITKHCVFSSPKPADLPLGPPIGATITSSANVLIGGVPMPSLLSMAIGAAFRGLGKAARSVQRGTRAGQRFGRWASQKTDDLLTKLGIQSEKWRNRVHRALCVATGHPVDVATGKMFTDQVDFSLPGPLPLRWERVYYSTSTYDGPLGSGWHHSYDIELVEADESVAVRLSDGRAVLFPPLSDGGEHFDRAERLALFRDRQGYAIRAVSGQVWRFSPVGQVRQQLLSVIEDRAGHRIDFRYDEAGNLQRIRDSAGRSLHLQTNKDGRILSVIVSDPDNAESETRLVSYVYDKHRDLVEVRDATDQPMKYAYEGHLLVRERDRNGLSFYFQYDGLGPSAQCVRTWGDGGIYDHKLSYDGVLQRTQVTNSLGNTTVYHWNESGLVTWIEDARGGSRKITYNEYNQPTLELDELGKATAYYYDERGNPIKILRPDGATLEAEYNRLDLPIRGVDAAGGEWGWAYDDQGQLVQQRDPAGGETRFVYSGSQLIGTIDPSGQALQFSYDAGKNLISVRAPDGICRRWAYDGLGRAVVATDPRNNVQLRRYNSQGWVTEIKEPDGNVRAFEYDPMGNIVHIKDRHRDVRFTYQGRGRLASRSETGITLRFEYDTEGRLISVINESDQVYRFELDELGNVAAEYNFDGTQRTYTRDATGRIVKVERASGLSTEYMHDASGRVREIRHSDGSFERYSYRHDGALLEATNNVCTVRFERDAVGRKLREWQGEYWVASEYDLQGRRVRIRSSFGAAQTIERKAIGDVTSIRYDDAFAEWEVRIQRDVMGLEMERRVPGGVRSRWARDQWGRPIHHLLSSAVTTRDVRYEWHIANRLNRVIDAYRGITIFRHDALGYLTWVQYSGGTVDVRMPDAVGNFFRTEERGERSYSPAGRLLRSSSDRGTTSYEYDAEGNLIRKTTPAGEWIYFWNAAGMLVSIVRPDGVTVGYNYDALGRRLEKTFRGKTTRWLWDGHVPLHEWSDGHDGMSSGGAPPGQLVARPAGVKATLAGKIGRNGAAWSGSGAASRPARLVTWVFEPGTFAPAGKIVDDASYSIITDFSGTPLLMLDANGRTVWGAEISLYGEVRYVEGELHACPFRWPGQYDDSESGLYYNRFRYYDPDAGCYISADPLRLKGGLRLYGYPRDPICRSDPFGLAPQGYSSDDASQSYYDDDVWGESHDDPDPPKYRTDQIDPSQPVVDHREARSHGGHPTDPDNLHMKAWEENARKGGHEGNYLRERRRLTRQLTDAGVPRRRAREMAEDVLSDYKRWIENDIHARVMDPEIIESLPAKAC